jgi:hypothetical protein
MTEADHSDIRASLAHQAFDFSADIAALRQLGADQFDAVRLHYLEVLAHRTSAHQGRVKRILDGKLALALAAFRARFEQAQGEARDRIASMAPPDPTAAAELQQRFKAGDFTGVRRIVARLSASAPRPGLAELTLYMAQHAPEQVDASFDGHAGLRRELKTTRYFRNTWSKLSVDKQVTQALEQAPKNAGPINSHMLVLRSLALMREISPDYLNRFTSYVDALLCLNEGEKAKPGIAKHAAKGDASKKVKSRPSRAR